MNGPHNISVSEFNYNLPQEKIPAFPKVERNDSRLLVYKQQHIIESVFKNLGNYLPTNSLLVFNNTRVVNARLHFLTSTKKNIELFCLGPLPDDYADLSQAMLAKGSVRWLCLVGNLKQWKEETLLLQSGHIELKASLLNKRAGEVEVLFNWNPAETCFSEVLEVVGQVPIPPYLKRESNLADKERYQTVYANVNGSVAAPTAGLHFTERQRRELKERGIEQLELTLHVGAGTFKPVKAETLASHDMHAEWISLDREQLLTLIHAQNKSIVSVGTTSLRLLESLYWMGLKAFMNPEAHLLDLEIKQWDVYELPITNISREQSFKALLAWMDKRAISHLACQTQILIAPPYKLKVANGLITNFHQPQSTLLLLVAAIVGENWKNIYNYALEHDFRFLSYGDSSLLLP